MKKIIKMSTEKSAGMRVAPNDVKVTEQRGEMRMESSGGVASGDVKVTEQRGGMRMESSGGVALSDVRTTEQRGKMRMVSRIEKGMGMVSRTEVI